MRWITLALLVLSGQPAFGQVPENTVAVTDCQMDTSQHAILGSVKAVCDLTNGFNRAIRSVEYGIRYVEDGRSVPWAEDGFSAYARLGANVPGGIEPGETVPVDFWGPVIPDRAPPDRLRVVVELTSITFSDGDELMVFGEEGDFANAPESAAVPAGPPMTGAERDAFRQAVQACWVVDPGAQSSGVSVSVVFELDRQGRVVSGPDLLESSGGSQSDEDAAFRAASRAITRCGRDGYRLPADKYDQWRIVEMTFESTGMRIR